MSKAPKKIKKYEDRLMYIFDFDEADLEANQAGQMSQRQRVRLKKMRNHAVLTFVLLATLFGFLTTFIVSAGLQSSNILPSLFTGLIAVLIIYSFSGIKAQWLLSDLSKNQIAMTEGRVELLLGNTQYKSEYFLLVGDAHLWVKQSGFLAFKNGDPYRIYYTPRARRILSVEWLREDDNLIDDERRDRLQDASASAAAEAEAMEDQSSINTTNTA